MKKKVGIIGYGVVGKAMRNLLGGHTWKDMPFYWEVYDDKDPVYNKKEPINTCDLGVICVPTPTGINGECNLVHIEEVLSWLETPLILIKSTVPPGTTEYLRKKYKKNINFSPEYIGESTYYTPPWKYPDPHNAQSHTFVIVGGNEASEILNYFMQVMSVDTKYVAVTSEEAELTKYMENAFFATKVAFCNEFYEIAKRYGIDYKKLRELWLLDSRINSNHTLVFEDKRGFGGKCLPKDLEAIIRASEKEGYTPTLLKAVIQSNEENRSRS